MDGTWTDVGGGGEETKCVCSSKVELFCPPGGG